ncbi:ABC transporter permease [Goodfellowiella coeruleoviolacea]|uniref:Autoinducer 2 import system permease protein LsrD n=1 Tax=Goodfellowiella coeruleoviolacea TaxID=334858 RepID=A0AAE3KJE7_9PSEU|nr:ABC transporter permease [Goodfellowiella coeruleoviolacea]MCP2164213.1 rhamnose transport system permease protein [Goodfellowiella coeruleoviolacea]
MADRIRAVLRWETALVVLLVAVAVVGSVRTDGTFLSGGNLFYLGLDIAEIALIALPLTLVIAAAEIDLSVASVLGLSSALIGWLWTAGWPLETILPVVVLVGAACGALNGLLVTRLGLPSLAVTIGTMALFRGLALVVLGDTAVADFPASYTQFGTTPVPGTNLPYPILLFAVLAVVFAVLLHASSFGRAVFAVGANEEAARFSGVRVKRTKLVLFVLTGAVAALAGIVYTFRFSSARADNGTGLELAVVAAVLLGGVSIFGGRGTLGGVVAGVLLLGSLRNLLILDDVSTEVLTVVTGLLLLVSVLVPAVGRRLGRRVDNSRLGRRVDNSRLGRRAGRRAATSAAGPP